MFTDNVNQQTSKTVTFTTKVFHRTEFWAKPRSLPVSVEFLHFCGI